MKAYFLKQFTLLFTGALLYGIIEITFRGYTHISMGILGGICFVAIGEVNRYFSGRLSILVQMFICAVIITTLEYFTGLIVNIRLGLCVWDYSGMPLNVSGQICPLFFVAWYFLSFLGIVVYQNVRWLIFKENRPDLSLIKVRTKNA